MDKSVTNPATAYRTDRAYSTSGDDSDEDKCGKRQATEKARAVVTSAGYDFAKSSALAGEPPLRRKRKVNNVWAAVLSEELLTKDLGQVSVAPAQPWTQDRQCESYDYMWGGLNRRPHTGEPDVPVNDDESLTTNDVVDVVGTAPRGAKRSFSDRLGERACTRPSRSRRPMGQGGVRSRRNESGSSKSSSSEREEDAVAKVVADIAKRLQEPKVDLLERAVNVLGIPQCLKFLGMTEDIESKGGLMTLDKSRRRTPGGVFFHLLRAQLPRRQMQLIFAEEMQEGERRRRKFRWEQSCKNTENNAAFVNCLPSDDTKRRSDAGSLGELGRKTEERTVERVKRQQRKQELQKRRTRKPAAAAVPLEYPRTSYSPTPLDGGSELDYSPTPLVYSPTRLGYSPTLLDGGSELDYSPTRLDYSPTPLDGGSEPMADQEPGTSRSVAEPMVAADQAAAEESDDDCQIEEGEILD